MKRFLLLAAVGASLTGLNACASREPEVTRTTTTTQRVTTSEQPPVGRTTTTVRERTNY